MSEFRTHFISKLCEFLKPGDMVGPRLNLSAGFFIGKHCLANTVWQTLSGKHCLANTVWQTLSGKQSVVRDRRGRPVPVIGKLLFTRKLAEIEG